MADKKRLPKFVYLVKWEDMLFRIKKIFNTIMIFSFARPILLIRAKLDIYYEEFQIQQTQNFYLKEPRLL